MDPLLSMALCRRQKRLPGRRSVQRSPATVNRFRPPIAHVFLIFRNNQMCYLLLDMRWKKVSQPQTQSIIVRCNQIATPELMPSRLQESASPVQTVGWCICGVRIGRYCECLRQDFTEPLDMATLVRPFGRDCLVSHGIVRRFQSRRGLVV